MDETACMAGRLVSVCAPLPGVPTEGSVCQLWHECHGFAIRLSYVGSNIGSGLGLKRLFPSVQSCNW